MVQIILQRVAVIARALRDLYIPHGSDNTELLDEELTHLKEKYFISHMVQIILRNIPNQWFRPSQIFISHMVQIILGRGLNLSYEQISFISHMVQIILTTFLPIPIETTPFISHMVQIIHHSFLNFFSSSAIFISHMVQIILP